MSWKRDADPTGGVGKGEQGGEDRYREVPSHEIVVDVKRVGRVLFTVLGALLLLFLGGKTSRLYIGPDRLLGLLQGVHPYFRATVPTWFAASSLLACAVLLAVIARIRKSHGEPFAFRVSVLAVAFLVLSMERSTGLLGTAGSSLAERFQVLDHLRVLGSLRTTALIVLFSAMFLFYRKPWKALPKRVRRFAAAAAMAYLIAQFGIRFVQTRYLAQHPDIGYDPWWVLLVAASFLVTTTAVILLLLSLLFYLGSETETAGLRFRIGSPHRS
ncbi:MAG: hypothetical protein ACE5HP_03705 [Gemmatimonadota bacterium]